MIKRVILITALEHSFDQLQKFTRWHLKGTTTLSVLKAVLKTLSFDLKSILLSLNLPHEVYINIYIYLQPCRVVITFSEAVTFYHNIISWRYLACVLRSNVPTQAVSTFKMISNLARC